MNQVDYDTIQAAGSPSPEHYLNGAIRLRQAATWNSFDSRPDRRLPQRIIPVVDADVIRLFMAPAEEIRYVNPFPGEADASTRREWDDPLVLVATATAEFIFLTGAIKIGGRDVGNWREPVRIATPHQHDVDTMLMQITRKIVDGLKTIDELEDEAIERLDSVLLKSAKEPDAAIKLVRALPKSLRDLYLGPVYEAERWIRLRKDGVLERLEGLAEATADILKGDDKTVERWRKLLFDALQRAPGPSRSLTRSRLAERAKERTSRDALVLASVTALNDAGLAAGPEKGWRAVLISGDEHLHDVYARWNWQNYGHSLRPEKYVLRRPLQYSPVLNVASMSDDDSAAGIFQKLTEALDLTISMLLDRSDIVRNPYWLEYYWRTHKQSWLGALDQKAIHEHLAECNRLWLEAINSINARNYAYLTRDYRNLFERLRSRFDEPHARDELRNYTINIVEEIDGEHFRLVLEETIAELAGVEKPMRMPFLIRANFPELLGGRSLTEFLYDDPSRLKLARHGFDELESIRAAILKSPGVEATLLTAILAAASGSFVRAARLMTRAAKLAADRSANETLRREMTYFEALLTRINVESERDYQRAKALLGEAPDRSRAGTGAFETAREQSERAALELQWFGVDAPLDTAKVSPNNRSHLTEAHTYLLGARDSATWNISQTTSRHERELAHQIVVNAMSLNVYLKLAGGEPDLEMTRWAQDQFTMLFGDALSDGDYLTKLWCLGAAWLVDPKPEARSAFLEHCTVTLDDPKVTELPLADRHDLERIKTYLERPSAAR